MQAVQTAPRLAGRVPALPYVMELADGSQLELLEWLRVLPDKRYVARARWRDQQVLAKVFVGPSAERHCRREQRGIQRLLDQGIATPALLYQDTTPRRTCLLTAFIAPTRSLSQEWATVAAQPLLSADQEALLARALAVIAAMHRNGIWHGDLHLGNLLVNDGNLLVIDGDCIRSETLGKPLSRRRARRNLGVFLAQLPVDLSDYLPQLARHYGLLPGSIRQLQRLIRRVQAWRLQKYLKKVQRDCTSFAALRTRDSLALVRRRQLDQDHLGPLVQDPDAVLANGRFYKQGGTAAVAAVDWHDQTWLLKRYNIKSVGHWLTRCWRASRAWHSWVAAHLLAFVGIPTASAVMVKEQRTFGVLRGPAWLLLEHCGDDDLLRRWAPWAEQGLPPQAEREALLALVADLRRLRIGHGDLKGHNLLWRDGQWLLIDLDSLRRYRSGWGYRRAYARDRARLLRNWAPHSALYQWLDQALPAA
ncbi:lipopolysaccharide kinase InaA family protein [Isoalcanivorax beigongshangi]|uniref:Lipopolysaccharide kinase InaA family protein n=1 Tax=Isoalcanivorax beigongshangi TaxID=3238810 RepID=A0ABV4AHK5_9GAMM